MLAQVGSGKTAIATLLHEGGHAAHFSNIKQASPFFSQERAPMSVAYAENQSMYLDSYIDDAAWLGRWVTGMVYSAKGNVSRGSGKCDRGQACGGFRYNKRYSACWQQVGGAFAPFLIHLKF